MKFREMTTVALIVSLFLFASVANAAVFNWGEGDMFQQLKTVFGLTSDGHNHDGTNSRAPGTATANPIFATNVTAAGFKQGVTTNVSTASTLTSADLAYGMILRTQDSPVDITVGIDDGVIGQMVTIKLIAKAAGNYIISKASFPVTTHSTGWSVLTFDTQYDQITLLWLDNTSGWVLVGNVGVTITQ